MTTVTSNFTVAILFQQRNKLFHFFCYILSRHFITSFSICYVVQYIFYSIQDDRSKCIQSYLCLLLHYTNALLFQVRQQSLLKISNQILLNFTLHIFQYYLRCMSASRKSDHQNPNTPNHPS